jgi:hypothetical protein
VRDGRRRWEKKASARLNGEVGRATKNGRLTTVNGKPRDVIKTVAVHVPTADPNARTDYEAGSALGEPFRPTPQDSEPRGRRQTNIRVTVAIHVAETNDLSCDRCAALSSAERARRRPRVRFSRCPAKLQKAPVAESDRHEIIGTVTIDIAHLLKMTNIYAPRIVMPRGRIRMLASHTFPWQHGSGSSAVIFQMGTTEEDILSKDNVCVAVAIEVRV